jgi:hypothetical protein
MAQRLAGVDLDPELRLLAAIVRRAIHDAANGEPAAREWLTEVGVDAATKTLETPSQYMNRRIRAAAGREVVTAAADERPSTVDMSKWIREQAGR